MSERVRTISHIWVEIARRLRRRGALTGLFVLLTIGLVEPLACIIHCEITELLSAPAISALHGHHNHAHSDAVAAKESSTVAIVAPPPDSMLCAQLHNGGTSHTGMPQSATPQPFHEMIVLLGVLFVAVFIIMGPHPLTSDPPRTRFVAPPLRPPILFA